MWDIYKWIGQAGSNMYYKINKLHHKRIDYYDTITLHSFENRVALYQIGRLSPCRIHQAIWQALSLYYRQFYKLFQSIASLYRKQHLLQESFIMAYLWCKIQNRSQQTCSFLRSLTINPFNSSFPACCNDFHSSMVHPFPKFWYLRLLP